MCRRSISLLLLALLILSTFTYAQTRTWKVGDKVEAKWHGRYYAAAIKEVKDGKYKVGFDGYGSKWDEWVTGESIRARVEQGGAKAQFQSVKPGAYHCVFYISGQGLQTVPGFTIQPGGVYIDSNGKKGSYSFDAAQSRITFTGAKMDGNVAKYDGKIRIYNERRSRTVIDCDSK